MHQRHPVCISIPSWLSNFCFRITNEPFVRLLWSIFNTAICWIFLICLMPILTVWVLWNPFSTCTKLLTRITRLTEYLTLQQIVRHKQCQTFFTGLSMFKIMVHWAVLMLMFLVLNVSACSHSLKLHMMPWFVLIVSIVYVKAEDF